MLIKYKQNLPEDFKKDGKKTYIAVIGGRDVDDYNFLCEKFLTFLEITGIDTKNIIFVSGGARGVDRMARRLAEELGKGIIEIIPDWERLKKRAGIERNKVIVDLADYIIAIPSENSKGTIQAISYAREKRRKVFVFKYEGIKNEIDTIG